MTLTDVQEEAALARRNIPCICPRQHEPEPPIGITTDIAVSRGIVVEAVACSGCTRKWKRVSMTEIINIGDRPRRKADDSGSDGTTPSTIPPLPNDRRRRPLPSGRERDDALR